MSRISVGWNLSVLTPAAPTRSHRSGLGWNVSGSQSMGCPAAMSTHSSMFTTVRRWVSTGCGRSLPCCGCQCRGHRGQPDGSGGGERRRQGGPTMAAQGRCGGMSELLIAEAVDVQQEVVPRVGDQPASSGRRPRNGDRPVRWISSSAARFTGLVLS